jgi:hypothetical protein
MHAVLYMQNHIEEMFLFGHAHCAWLKCKMQNARPDTKKQEREGEILSSVKLTEYAHRELIIYTKD